MIGFAAFICFGLFLFVSYLHLSSPSFKTEILELDDRYEPHVEDEESIRALVHHPGFVALTNRLRLQSVVLSHRLNTAHHEDIREVDNLQNGLKWLNYLTSEVNRSVQKKQEARAAATRPHEEIEFKKAFALIEGV